MRMERRSSRRLLTLLALVVALAVPLSLSVPDRADAAMANGMYTQWFDWVWDDIQGWLWCQVGEEGTTCTGQYYFWGSRTSFYQTGNHCAP